MNIKILVATHKAYTMPEDSMYLPIHVGKAVSSLTLPYIGDNTGTHISAKNPNYCELTGIYWAWKNVSADYIGLAHYRRHFILKRFCRKKLKDILSFAEAEQLLQNTSVILPKPRNYIIETNYSQFIHAHPAESIKATKQILTEIHPTYVAAYEHVMKQTKAHRFNMFIMKKDVFDNYCEWLFSILFTLEDRLDISAYNTYNQRIFGFISERLLDVYLTANNISYQELPVLFMEKEHWIKKGFSFLKRKFMYKKTP